MAQRLTEKHPLTKDLRLLEAFMRDNNLFLDWDGYRINFSNSTYKAVYKDQESSENLTEFPNMVETKLIQNE